MSASSLVEISGVGKAFGGVRALCDISLELAPGEVHALCGENGAGKSTLNKILSGALAPDAGAVRVGGRQLAPGSVPAAEAAGIAIIHQESTAFLHLNAEDNIFIGREPRRLGGLLLDRQALRQRTRALLDRLGERFDSRRPLGELTVAQRQMVGIARALSRQCRLLIMDEPTSSLSARETEVLFRIIRQLRADGVSILYVSHRLEEVFALADRVTVLRDGRLVDTRPVGELDRETLIKLMVGREVEAAAPGAVAAPAGEALLEVAGLTRAGAFHDVSFTVRAGEIVGLAGLVGAGRTEVARAIFGIDRPDAGSVKVAGKTLPRGSPRAAIERGVSLVPEDRQQQGLAPAMTVSENLTLPVLRSLTRGGLLSRRREGELTARLMRELAVRAAGPRAPVETLSGGNQQKVLLGKWLATKPRALILDEPTRGGDVGAKAEVHKLIRQLAANGVAVLLISSELPEILALSDRTIVMREGAVAGELPRAAATQEKVLELALPRQADAEPPPSALGVRRSALVAFLRQLARRREYGILALLALTVAVAAARSPAFLSLGNISDMLVNCAPVAIIACGVTFVIITREIDISVGSLMGLLAATVGLLTAASRLGCPVWLGASLTLLLGASVGLFNGLLVTVGRVPSIVVTLGMLIALQGATDMVLDGEWITPLPADLRYLGVGKWLGAPICIWAALAVILLSAAIARWTPLGRRLYAVGDNPRAAALAGLSPRRIRLFAFAYTGLLTAVATLVSAPQLDVIEAGFGRGKELLVVTCVVVGGTSIAGGRGGILGSTLGVLLLGSIATVLIFMQLGPRATYWERAIQGLFILVAVLADHLARRREETA